MSETPECLCTPCPNSDPFDHGDCCVGSFILDYHPLCPDTEHRDMAKAMLNLHDDFYLGVREAVAHLKDHPDRVDEMRAWFAPPMPEPRPYEDVCAELKAYGFRVDLDTDMPFADSPCQVFIKSEYRDEAYWTHDTYEACVGATSLEAAVKALAWVVDLFGLETGDVVRLIGKDQTGTVVHGSNDEDGQICVEWDGVTDEWHERNEIALVKRPGTMGVRAPEIGQWMEYNHSIYEVVGYDDDNLQAELFDPVKGKQFKAWLQNMKHVPGIQDIRTPGGENADGWRRGFAEAARALHGRHT